MLLGQKHQVGTPFQVSAQHCHLPQQLPLFFLRGRAVPGQKLIHPDDLGGQLALQQGDKGVEFFEALGNLGLFL